MMLNQVKVLYFSPNGTTKKVALSIAHGMSSGHVEYDLTPFDARWKKIELSDNDAVVIALPSYYGRLPGICREFFRGIKGNKTPAIIAVTYGNHQYGDALIELKALAQQAGFLVVGAGAFPAEHCMNKSIGTARPDAKDVESMHEFGDLMRSQIESSLNCEELTEIGLGSKFPYTYRTFDSPISPTTNEACVKCGNCANVCPVKAINPDNTFETDATRCILCFKCVNECGQGARVFSNERIEKQLELVEMMSKSRKNIIFYHHA